jgi:hypothetical protein
LKVVNSLVSEEKDLLGALNLLHPELHDGLTSYIKKLQRKVETFELKQSIGGKNEPEP